MPGVIAPELISPLLAALPLDITFIDAGDVIRYYSGYRIFSRKPEVLGTKVQACHSPETRSRVDEVIAKLRNGSEREIEQFAEKDGRRVRVLYTAVRDGAGQYRGLLETVAWIGETPPRIPGIRPGDSLPTRNH
jgi:uncharacterized protein